MKKAGIILAAVMALTISGCSEVPEDVKSRTEAKNQAISEAEKHLEERTGEIQYISPDELEEDVKAALGQSYANFSIDPSVKVSVPKEIVKCDFKQRGDYLIAPETVFERIFGHDTAAKYDLSENTLKGGMGKYTSLAKGVRVNEEKIHFVNWQNGFLCFIRNDLFTIMDDTGQRTALYRVDRGDELSDKYLLGDKEISVADAVDTAQRFIDENYADLEPQYKVRVKTVIARQDDYGKYTLEFVVNKAYKDIPLDELAMVIDQDHKENLRYKYRKYCMNMTMRNAGEIDYLTNMTGIVDPVETGTLDKIVSLKSALEHIEKKFTDFENPLCFNYIGLKYLLSPQYDESDTEYNEVNVMNRGKIVWEFVMDTPTEQLVETLPNGETVPISNHMGDIRTYIYIDAETGDMDFDLQPKMM